MKNICYIYVVKLKFNFILNIHRFWICQIVCVSLHIQIYINIYIYVVRVTFMNYDQQIRRCNIDNRLWFLHPPHGYKVSGVQYTQRFDANNEGGQKSPHRIRCPDQYYSYAQSHECHGRYDSGTIHLPRRRITR